MQMQSPKVSVFHFFLALIFSVLSRFESPEALFGSLELVLPVIGFGEEQSSGSKRKKLMLVKTKLPAFCVSRSKRASNKFDFRIRLLS